MKQFVTQAIALVPVLMLHGMALFMALGVYALVMLSSATTNTSKSYTLEQRLQALLPQTFPNTGGQINGNVNVSGTHSANQLIAGGVSSGASVAGTTNHFTGSTQTDGNHSVGGQVSSSSANIGGSGSSATVAVNGNVHASSSGQFDGGIFASNYNSGQGAPSGYPIAHGTPWENQVIDFLNSMVSKLQSAGVY